MNPDRTFPLHGGSTDVASSSRAVDLPDDAPAETAESPPGEVPEPATIGVVGLGYVGLPLAAAFDAADQAVIGYDIDEAKVERLRAGTDPTGDVGDDRVAECDVAFTADPTALSRAEYVLITVPTPIDDHENPDLEFVRAAGETVGSHLAPGTTVVLESTVYPGATETLLAPAIESTSGLAAGEDFTVAYSPERASPGQEGRGVEDVVKIVGADDVATREELATLYGRIVEAGIHRAPDVETAETAKVIENVQRDINIALMNELAIACDHMDISTEAVLEAAGTKWNFHDGYRPGLVGGHCIPVDPHFLAHRSEHDGFSPKLVLQAREINSYVPSHVADLVVRSLNDCRHVIGESRVLVLGLSYKPDVGDIRTSEVDRMMSELRSYDVDVGGYDPHADPGTSRETFDAEIQDDLDPTGFDALVVATGHTAFEDLDLARLAERMGEDPAIVDVAGIYDEDVAAAAGFEYRRL